MRQLCDVRYHRSLWTLRRASPAPVPVPQSKEQSQYLFFGKKQKTKTEETYRSTAVHTLMLSIKNTHFDFFRSFALSTSPMCTNWVTTWRRVRLLLFSNGSRVSTISGTERENTYNADLIRAQKCRANKMKGREQTFRMTVLLVQLPQLLFLLFGPRWPLSLSGTLTIMSSNFYF